MQKKCEPVNIIAYGIFAEVITTCGVRLSSQVKGDTDLIRTVSVGVISVVL